MENKISMKKAVFINAGGKYTKIFLSIIVNAILARIVSPNDYGIVAVITVFSTFFSTFSDMGFGPAIVQQKNLKKEDIDNIFSFTVYVSVILMVIFDVLSYPIASFYGDEVYIRLGQMLSVSLLFNAMNMVPNGILNRDKKFVSIAVRTIVVYVVSAVVTIILASMGLRYYALAIQAILTSIFQFVWNFATTKPKFRACYKTESIKKVLNYSGYQFAFNVVNYFSRNLDNLLTGRFMGNAELGYYNKAYTLMLYPVNNLTGVVSPVLHPLLSDYQDQKEIIYKKYMKIVHLLGCIGIYVAPACFLAASEIINILYGSNWKQAVSCFQILSIAIIPQMINSSAGSIFQAIGNTKLLFINSCINTVITIIAILLGVFGGKTIDSLSAYIAVAYMCHFLTAFIMLIKIGFKYSLLNFVKDLIPEMVMLVIMIFGMSVYPFDIASLIVSLIVKCIYLGIIFCICLLITKRYKLFFSFVKGE